jgi:hypothetical protein
MPFEVGQIIAHKCGFLTGIIIDHYVARSSYSGDLVECIKLFVTLDNNSDFNSDFCGRVVTFEDFSKDMWKSYEVIA